MNTLLEANGVSVKGMTGFRLKDINLKIDLGDKVALIGKSGSGKTTLLNVLNGALTCDGDVLFNGQHVKGLKRKYRRNIATFWQDLRLIEELSVGQNINCGALGKHNPIWALRNLMGEIGTKKCITCMDAAELSIDLINEDITKLSSGQRTRVAIARLFRQESEIILADEPFSHLDKVLTKKILNTFLHLKSYQDLNIANTYLISIHQLELLDKFTRVIGLKGGEIVLDYQATQIKTEDIENLYK
ncbi:MULTISPECIES: ATP-binding cassette domain-containing protein [unclassified Prochlorococcus]|uniref:ATP-binding cassette domain-containing protein n=1 Tax=unclassified Prochlorococcus TaxID=2627481 RepID=UPI0005339C5B|nr:MULTISPECIES: ATP-binding cassette domain-containing protein [unclassified Prochlorococcus]KGG15345.1 Phosphonate ABC transporter ATP-binding protein [Prochlorococcus sp. MIT 0602]KGG17623.1 Phosphonate ABC transporter ATP-binding protein [Prochlorococcus sp. MIT 0603]